MEKQMREKAKDSNLITREYFNEIIVEMRHIDATVPSTALSLYGKTFATPVMMAALSHLKGQDGQGDGMVQMAEGAKLANAVNWSGMDTLEQFADIMASGAPTIRIIKPYADDTLVQERIHQAEALGALAVGMDLDHSFNAKGTPDNVLGYPMRSRTLKEIEGYCKQTELPFIIKGVLSAADAKKCLEAGVRGIVVSHHHGILPTVVPPLMVLPEIIHAVQGKIPVFIDCGFMNGTDVFKALAMGATAVSIGRPVMPGIAENGASGAASIITAITEELAGMMARTCSPDIQSIDSSLLWHRNGTRLFAAAE